MIGVSFAVSIHSSAVGIEHDAGFILIINVPQFSSGSSLVTLTNSTSPGAKQFGTLISASLLLHEEPKSVTAPVHPASGVPE